MNIEKKSYKNQFVNQKNQFATAYVYCLNHTIEVASFLNKKIYYKFDGNFKTSYYRHEEKNGLFTFKLPKQIIPHQIKKLNFLNCTRSKISWGSKWSRLGGTINRAIPFETFFIDYASNSTVCDINSLQFPENKITLMWLKEKSGADIRCNQFVWFNWFFYKNDYYIQILYELYAETWGSLIGGAMWLNLGTVLEIELF